MSQAESNNSDQSNSASREVAYRLFAEEMQQIAHQYRAGDGEYAPNYVLLPSGAEANRVFVVGTLTEVEDVGDGDNEYWRATVNDGSGNFMVYAGQYQPEAAAALRQIDPPEYVAVSGKVKTFETDDGDLLANIRPESFQVISEETRDHWVLETAAQTLDRLETDTPEHIQEMLLEQYGPDTSESDAEDSEDEEDEETEVDAEDAVAEVQDKVRQGVIRALENFEDQDN